MPVSRGRKRGRSRVHRNTYDLNDQRAQVHAPLTKEGILEESVMVVRAFREMVRDARSVTHERVRYGQGFISRVGEAVIEALLSPKQGFDHFSGTNDLAGSAIAKAAVCSQRQWYRLKPQLREFGILDYRHRSVESGLAELGGEPDLQVSDIYWFTPERLLPWLRELYDAALARIRANTKSETRTPLVKRDRPHRRIPALLNPAGYAIALAALARPKPSYADREAEAVAFATQFALRPHPI